MNDNQLKDRWALVTGASSGFGVDFSKELASRGCNVVLTARRVDRLEQRREELSQLFGISVEVLPLDLSPPEAPQQLYDQIKSANLPVDVLINNAGFGLYGRFADLSWERQQEMLQLNILTLTHLTKLFLQDMLQRNFGYILHVASNSAYQPTPMFAAYGASKSFVLNFSEALRFELRGTNIKCTAISPGPVITEFQKVAGQDEAHPYVRLNKIESSQVARIGIQAMLKGRSSIIPGGMVALVAWIGQRAPRTWATAISGWLMSL